MCSEVESRTIQEELEILKKLSAPLHTEAIQRTKDKLTHKGYDTDGYGYQFCVNRFNEVLGCRWGYYWEVINTKEGSTSTGKANYEITVKLGIWILNSENVRYGVGGHVSKTHFDATKGAFTNAFKKTAAFWGVGRQAYEGALDDDNDPWPEFARENGLENGSPANGVQAQQQAPQQSTPPKQPEPSQTNGKGNGHAAGQNGNASIGNGTEEGLRKKIYLRLKHPAFGSSNESINQWLQTEFRTLPNIEAIEQLDLDKLKKLYEIIENKVKNWKKQ